VDGHRYFGGGPLTDRIRQAYGRMLDGEAKW